MTAADPEGRIQHQLDVWHSTRDINGDPLPFGMVPMADGNGLTDYIDKATFGGGGSDLESLSDVDLTSPTEGDTLRYVSGMWINDPRKWEAVTDGEDVFVWVGDDLVHEWSS